MRRLRKAKRQAARYERKAQRTHERIDRLQKRCAATTPDNDVSSRPGTQNSRARSSISTRLGTRWRNISMAGAFSIYVTFYLLVALVGSLATASYFSGLQTQIQADNDLYDGIFIYDPDQDVLLRARSVMVESDASPVGYLVLYVQNYSGIAHIPPSSLPNTISVLDISFYPQSTTTGLLLIDEVADTFVLDFPSSPGGSVDPHALAEYNARASAIWAAATNEQEEAFLRNSAGLMVSPIAYYLHETPSAEALVAEGVTGVLAFLMFPLWFGLCIYMAGRRFYNERIKPAIELFDQATLKITEQDLDFVVAYNRDDELGRVAQSFETMRSSLAQSQRSLWATAEERRHLNAAFAHDLRTPLTILRGKIELLQARADSGTLDPDRLREACATLTSQIERLERYVQAMSSVQRLEDRTLTWAPLDLTVLATDLGEVGSQLCSSSSKTFRWEKPSIAPDVRVVHADRAAIVEVAENLIGNAARYAESTVTARMVIEAEDNTSGPILVLTIEDDGPGFSPEALEQGLEPFYSERKMEGHFGLGLNISRLLCQKHGGTLELSNRSDVLGSCVIARFACPSKP